MKNRPPWANQPTRQQPQVKQPLQITITVLTSGCQVTTNQQITTLDLMQILAVLQLDNVVKMAQATSMIIDPNKPKSNNVVDLSGPSPAEIAASGKCQRCGNPRPNHPPHDVNLLCEKCSFEAHNGDDNATAS